MDEQALERLKVLVELGKKVAAIKAYREMTGADLEEAIVALEVYRENEGVLPEGVDITVELHRLLRKEEYIYAIRLYRRHFAVSLKEAHAAIEAMKVLPLEEIRDPSLKEELENFIHGKHSGDAIRLYSDRMDTSVYYARSVIKAMRQNLQQEG